jgi:predicted Rossmann-fold nucleotide-binding protein
LGEQEVGDVFVIVVVVVVGGFGVMIESFEVVARKMK